MNNVMNWVITEGYFVSKRSIVKPPKFDPILGS